MSGNAWANRGRPRGLVPQAVVQPQRPPNPVGHPPRVNNPRQNRPQPLQNNPNDNVREKMKNLSVSGGETGGGDNEGNGRRGPGKRGIQRRQPLAEKIDFINTRPADVPSKQGEGGTPINLVANFFGIGTKPNWTLYNYHVTFLNSQEGGMEERRTRQKIRLLAQHGNNIGLHLFDGGNLFTINRLAENLNWSSTRDDGAIFRIELQFVGEVSPVDINYYQFFNLIMRKCLRILNFTLIGRHYYDSEGKVSLPELGLELIPGFITTIRKFEERVLLCVELTHKVLRTVDCLSLMNEISSRATRNNPEQRIREEIIGSIVMTRYNNRTYKIDDILFDRTPSDTFNYRGSNISFEEYYRTKYQLRVSQRNQPLLVSRPTRRDIHRGDHSDIILIPEFCNPTGIDPYMRSNQRKMAEISQKLQKPPKERVQDILAFMHRIRNSSEARNLLGNWELTIQGQQLVQIEQGRVLPKQTLKFAGKEEMVGSDWTSLLRGKINCMAVTMDLLTKEWVLIYPRNNRLQYSIEDLIGKMQTVGNGMGFKIHPPVEKVPLADTRASAYVEALEDMKNKHKELKVTLTILPQIKDNSSVYAAIKRRTLSAHGKINQCMKEHDSRRVMSVLTKMLIQLNAKRGGEPWKISLSIKGKPLPPTMIVGFDVYHPGQGGGGKRSFGAVVASTNIGISKFYTRVSPHGSRDEISTKIADDILECAKEFARKNPKVGPPTNIIFYRDGVGLGQLSFVHGTEVQQILATLRGFYKENNRREPRLTFIVVTKRGNARILQKDSNFYMNPPPGTVVDTTITLPERYDFYLIPQQGKTEQTVSPTAFNVIHDEIRMSPAELQEITFRLCHMYFNWTGTVAVPAVCQYAHKLAFVTGTALDESGSRLHSVQQNLLDTLYFL